MSHGAPALHCTDAGQLAVDNDRPWRRVRLTRLGRRQTLSDLPIRADERARAPSCLGIRGQLIAARAEAERGAGEKDEKKERGWSRSREVLGLNKEGLRMPGAHNTPVDNDQNQVGQVVVACGVGVDAQVTSTAERCSYTKSQTTRMQGKGMKPNGTEP